MKKLNRRPVPWAFYFLIVLLSIFLHELGHCLVAWMHGVKAIPTLAKAYVREPIPDAWGDWTEAGGVLTTVVVSLAGIVLYVRKPSNKNSTLMAGTIALPCMYALLFLIKGRGHDETEFQQAQSAIGLDYSGHFFDKGFLVISVVGTLTWGLLSKPSLRGIVRVLVGALLTFIMIIAIQKANNAIFDPIFGR